MAEIKGLTKSDRPIMQISFRSTIRSMIGNIKKLFLPKIFMWRKQVLQDPGNAEWIEVHAACYVAKLHEISYVEGVKRIKIAIIQ